MRVMHAALCRPASRQGDATCWAPAGTAWRMERRSPLGKRSCAWRLPSCRQLSGSPKLVESGGRFGKRPTQCLSRTCSISLKASLSAFRRYLVAEVGWAPLAQSAQHVQRARALLARLLGLIYEAADLVLGPLSRPQVGGPSHCADLMVGSWAIFGWVHILASSA